MGRITIFGTNECSHCMRAKGALMVRGIPFVEIDLLQHPRRRADLSSLLLLSKTTTSSSTSSTTKTSSSTTQTQTPKTPKTQTVIGMAIPQVFFNEQSIGGADELLARLEEWDNHRDGDSTAHSVWEQTIQRQEDPTDPRLAIPTTILPTTKQEQEQDKEKDVGHYLPTITKTNLPLLQIPLPGNDDDDNDDNDDRTSSSSSSSCTALELLQRLDQVLDQADRAYKAHWYKNCFVNTEGVTAIQQEFRLKSRTDAVQFLQRLQRDYQLIHHVCDDHLFRDDGYYFFRLSMYHQPDILNSYLVWNKVVVDKDDHDHDHDDPMSLVLDLKRQLYDILSHYTDHNGLIDYVQSAKDARFATLEVAACALQDVDMATMDETTRKAFGLNLYNLFITYAFIKVGIGTSSTWSRGAFFGQVKMNIGGDILSFNDLENGILRANTRHPYASKPPFGVNDERLKRGLPLSQLDCRIHFALNCGAKSCPPIRFFCAGGSSGSGGGGEASLEEELLLVSQAFCQGDDAVCIKEDIQEIQLSMLFKWFQSDFCATKEQLPERLLEFLTGPKRQALERMLQQQQQQQQQSGTTSRSSSSISIRFLPYDWSANASNFKPYQRSHLRANEYSATALLRFQGHFDSCLSSLSSSSSLAQTTSTSTDAVVSVN